MTALTLTGCGFATGEESASGGESGSGDCAEVTLRLATIRTDDDPTTIAAQSFADAVDEATDGQVTVQVFPNSQLGDANDLFAGMASGQDVDMFYEGISLYPTLEGASDFAVVSVPFMWDSYEQFKAVLETDRYQELLDQAAEATGVRVVATAGDAEPRALSANRPIRTADEMAGLKLRIADAPMPQAFATALGAEPTVVPFSDLYLALRQGVVDGQENGAITMVNQSLFEVQPYFMPTNYIRDVRSWYVSDQVWGGLCADQQDAIVEEANAAGDVATEEVATQLEEAMTALEGSIEVVEPDVESFRTALEGTFEQFDGELWQEGLLEETRQLAEENR
ncbi:TRAP transporter substrate-binding protein [Blastococcus jejuensis]|uniref:TRAP transporter substrate-binding protein n=1 Tax=Blastococcus jejuensis TaxID=351224 RepID=UPI0031D05591